jgi:hypothetical protein
VRARLRARQQDEIKIGQWSAPLEQPHHGEKMTVRMTVSLIATEGYNCHVQCQAFLRRLRIRYSSDQPQGDADARGRPPMNLTLSIPEELYKSAKQIAAAENVSLEELFASAFEERILEFERLKERAAQGSYEKFRRVMAKIPPC